MRGRLTLARALLHRPELLFLDEPTAGLDPVNARLVRQVIREVREAGATIFLTTHDMVTADELCDRVAFLVEGTIVALDSPRALRLAHGRRRVRLEVTRDGTRAVREFPLDGLAEEPGVSVDSPLRRHRDDAHARDDTGRRLRSGDREGAGVTAFVDGASLGRRAASAERVLLGERLRRSRHWRPAARRARSRSSERRPSGCRRFSPSTCRSRRSSSWPA